VRVSLAAALPSLLSCFSRTAAPPNAKLRASPPPRAALSSTLAALWFVWLAGSIAVPFWLVHGALHCALPTFWLILCAPVTILVLVLQHASSNICRAALHGQNCRHRVCPLRCGHQQLTFFFGAPLCLLPHSIAAFSGSYLLLALCHTEKNAAGRRLRLRTPVRERRQRANTPATSGSSPVCQHVPYGHFRRRLAFGLYCIHCGCS